MFGHVVGDELLCAVARRLELAADGSFIARVGGDEFTLISTEGAQPQAAEALGRARCCRRSAEPFEVRGQQIPIGLSIGAAIYPRDGADAMTLLANADAALYRAKAEGASYVRASSIPTWTGGCASATRCSTICARPIAHDELVLHYQPQAKIDGEVFGFEALVRWQHPKHGFVPPATFIPLAEQNGMIVEIGAWALREACREAASWTAPLQIGVNLSPVQFRYGDLAGLVHRDPARDRACAPGRLELEITEGVLISDTRRARFRSCAG